MNLLNALIVIQIQLLHLHPQVFKRKLISIRNLSIPFWKFLDCIVSQMHKGIIGWRILTRVLKRAQPDVSFFENKALHAISHQHPDTHIEFTLPNQHRLLQILLNQESICLNYRRAFGDDPNILIAIEVSGRLLPFLPIFSIGWISHQHWLLDLLAILLHVIDHWLLLLLNLFPQTLLHISAHVVCDKLNESVQLGKYLNAPASVQEGRLNYP